MAFDNVIAHLDLIARTHAANARNDRAHTPEERKAFRLLQLEYQAAIRELGGEPSPDKEHDATSAGT